MGGFWRTDGRVTFEAMSSESEREVRDAEIAAWQSAQADNLQEIARLRAALMARPTQAEFDALAQVARVPAAVKVRADDSGAVFWMKVNDALTAERGGTYTILAIGPKPEDEPWDSAVASPFVGRPR